MLYVATVVEMDTLSVATVMGLVDVMEIIHTYLGVTNSLLGVKMGCVQNVKERDFIRK
jgi:hypothetical protein